MGSSVLYIEDNPDNMMLVRRALESRGYTILNSATGIKGVDMAEKETIDLILLDINLPKRNVVTTLCLNNVPASSRAMQYCLKTALPSD